jgi:hypothetical protein
MSHYWNETQKTKTGFGHTCEMAQGTTNISQILNNWKVHSTIYFMKIDFAQFIILC